MELEIKHLAPYLPYGLMLQYVVRGEVVTTGKMTSISHHDSETHPTKVRIEYADSEHIWMFKPLLRKKAYLDKLKDEIIIRWGGGLTEKSQEMWLDVVIDDMMYSAPNSIRYDFMEFMFEHHIDVFGLIDAGLSTELPH